MNDKQRAIVSSMPDIKSSAFIAPSTSSAPVPSQSSADIHPQRQSSADPNPPSSSAMADALIDVFTYSVPIIIAARFRISKYWSGVLHGVCFLGLTKALWQLFGVLLTGESDEPEKGPFKLPQYKLLPPLKSPCVPLNKRVCFHIYGLPYDPETYSVKQTSPVCLELEGSLLRITRVKTKLGKRAHFTQLHYDLDHYKKAEYDLSRCTVQLLPEDLVRKKWYSKKYPIAVYLDEGAILDAGGERFHTGHEAAFYSSNKKDDSEDKIKIASPVLYLFARCSRDKEDWYRRLLAAAVSFPGETNLAAEPEEADQSTATDKEEKKDQTAQESPLTVLEEYLLSLSKFVDMPPDLMGNGILQGTAEMGADSNLQWLNAFFARILFDMFRSPFWLNKCHEKLQKKLSSLKRPEYVDEMEITEMEMGREGPTIHRISPPVVDERGLWFDLDISYRGTMCCTIQTKLNLLRARKQDVLKVEEEAVIHDKMKNPVFDSETEEWSTDDDEHDEPSHLAAHIRDPDAQSHSKSTKSKTSHNFLRLVETVGKSKAFQHVAHPKLVQRVIEGVSHTKLQLHVQVDGIVGTMAVNIPPPPSDRLWYGFRTMPKVWLKAKPLVGEWNVKFFHVTNWIEKQLIKEFQYILVLPNMKLLLLPSVKTPEASVAKNKMAETPPPDEEQLRISLHRHASIWRKTKKEIVGFKTSPFLLSPSFSHSSSQTSIFDNGSSKSRKSVDFDVIHQRFKTIMQMDSDVNALDSQAISVKSGDFELPPDVTEYFLDVLHSLNHYDFEDKSPAGGGNTSGTNEPESSSKVEKDK